MDINAYLKTMVDENAADLYLTVRKPPTYRIEGKNRAIGEQVFEAVDLEQLAAGIMNERQRKEFSETMEMNLALSLPGLARFRVNIFQQRGSVGMVVRRINADPPSLEQLGLPTVINDVAMSKRGLALIVGSTGSGKSTTLAAIINHRNVNEAGHIITIEDPIEFVHQHKQSIITQREVGFDTLSFQAALKNTLRQAPDVILVGEIRDAETMEAAITFAETGHLCLATLHSNNANQAIERVMNFFPIARHSQIYMQLSLNLRAIISQRLVRSRDDKRVVAMEILLDTPRIKDLIKKGDVDALKDAMEQGVAEGCQTFDQALFALYKASKISLEQALVNADSANNLRLKIKLAGLALDEAPDESQKEQNPTEVMEAIPEAAKSTSPFRFQEL